MRKIIFQQIRYKNCRVAFRLVLQLTANLLGSRKRANTHSHRLLVFAPTVFLFCSCILMRIIYTWLTKSVFTAHIGLSLMVVISIIFFWIKYPYQNTQQKYNYHRRKDQGPIGKNHCAFSAAQNIWSKLQNQATCDSAAFTTNPLKLKFSYTFWLLQVAIIERTIIARLAIVPYLFIVLYGMELSPHFTIWRYTFQNLQHLNIDRRDNKL